jgi:uncharacterized membrane protein
LYGHWIPQPTVFMPSLNLSSELSLSIEPIYGSSWLAIIAAATIVGILIGVTPPTEDRRRRWTLLALRGLAGLLLIAVLFRPTLVRSDNQPAPATLVIGIDQSRSMTLPDGSNGLRWKTQAKAVASLEKELSSIDDELLTIRWLAYGQRVREISNLNSIASEEPTDDQTDISGAISECMSATNGGPLAGVVLMGDGTETTIASSTADDGGAKSADSRRAVGTLDAMGVPLMTVPIGPATTGSRRDVAIESLPESFSLFSGNQFDVPFLAKAKGLTGVEFGVELVWMDEAGKKIPAASRNVLPSTADDSMSMQVSVTVPPPGTYQLAVTAETVTGETRTTNNQQLAFVDVREGGGRILYLEGSPRLEQTFLRRSVREFPDLDLTYRWIPADTRKSWPINLDDVFQTKRFDVFIIGDLPAAALGSDQLAMLADRVREGAGLITLGGGNTYTAGGYHESPLAELLPIKMPTTSSDLQPPITIQLAQTHPITDLGGDDPAATWKSLPALLGADAMGTLRTMPGAATLLQASESEPLLSIATIGRGRVASLAFDSTWRWWKGGANDTHRTFWRQLLLWLMAREESSGDLIRLTMDRRRIEVGQSANFLAEVPSTNPIRPLTLVATVIGPDGKETPVLSSDNVQSLKGTITDRPPGIYRLQVRAKIDPSSPEKPIAPAEMSFQVIDRSAELDRPEADLEWMRQMAAMTAKHGGRSFEPTDMKSLAQQIIQDRRRSVTPVVDRFRLGDGPISGWSVYGLFAMALSVEWFLRRRWNLV